MKAGLFLFLVLFLGIASAWPYQVNTSTGEIIDINASNNQTTNLTIYIYNYTTTEIINVTNVSVSNFTNSTCHNCTYQNYTNITYTNETFTGGNYYTKSVSDARYEAIANAYKVPLADYNNLVKKVDDINITSTEGNVGSEAGLWVMTIFAALLAIGAIMLALRGAE